MHDQIGSVMSHLAEVHRVKPTSEKLLGNTKGVFPRVAYVRNSFKLEHIHMQNEALSKHTG